MCWKGRVLTTRPPGQSHKVWSKETASSVSGPCLVDGLAALPRAIPFLFLAEGACGEQETDTVPRGQGNGKCSRTSCSWETFRLVVCALETWLLVFLAQTFGPWQGHLCFCLDACASLALVMCVVRQWRRLGLSLLSFRSSNRTALYSEIETLLEQKSNKASFLILAWRRRG